MSWGGPAFVIAIVGLSIAGWMFTTWVRASTAIRSRMNGAARFIEPTPR